MKPCPTSSADIAATSQVTRARNTMASSRSTSAPREQLDENVLEGRADIACLGAELSERPEGQGAPFGQQQDAISDFFRVAQLMHARDDGRAIGQNRANGCENIA